MEEWVSGVEDTTEEMDPWVRKNAKSKIFLIQNTQESGTILKKKTTSE